VPAFFAIVAGKDEYLVNRDAQAFYTREVKSAGADGDAETLSGIISRVDEAMVIEQQFIEAVRTISMFGGKKIVWLRNLNWLMDSPQGRSDEVKASLSRLLKAAAESGDQVSIIISATPYDGRRKELVEYKSSANEFILHNPAAKKPWEKTTEHDRMLMEMAAKILTEKGVKFSRGVPEVIVSLVGQSTRVVLAEAEKLAIYAGAGGTIKENDVMLLVPAFGEGEFFEPIEALFVRDVEWTTAALDRYFFHQSSARPLLAGLLNRIRLLIQIRSIADAGGFKVTTEGLASGQFKAAAMRYGGALGSGEKSSTNLFSQNDWYISNKVAPGAAYFTLNELINLQLACGECFDGINSGQDEEVAIRALFLRALAVRQE
jgi:DNA polymerase III subunit delta